MKLSICVVTMNRSIQLREALESCLACDLSAETEFVIIDNASTDNTDQIVKETLDNSGFEYYYEKLPENLGVGGGRNYAFDKACGNYVYMLDDDAVIDNLNPDFFKTAITLLDKNADIATFTTQIYDTVWERNHMVPSGKKISDELFSCFMFCGGSHFLRKSFFVSSPYLPNKYGYEEIPPSLRAVDAGKINVFCPHLLIIHKPLINKWDYNDEKNHELLVKGIALPYAIKSMMYPAIFLPVLKLAMKRRIKKHMVQIPDAGEKVKEVVNKFRLEYPIKTKIKFSTVCRMFVDFKLSIF